MDIGGGGWADDSANDEDAKIRKAREDAERATIQRMAGQNATSLSAVKLEGVDEGVLGIDWVLSVLKSSGAWPPKVDCLTPGKDTYVRSSSGEGDPLASPAVRRNMILMVARMNSLALNTHPALMSAARENKIDGRYFQESLKFRMKVSLLLEACLRVAMAEKNADLARTIVETVAMYKIGVKDPTKESSIAWFQRTIQAQYGPGNVPSIKVHKSEIFTDDEDEVACNDTCTLSVEMERTHAAAFTSKKAEMIRKQGLDVKEQLSKYREGWWFVVSSTCLKREKVGSGVKGAALNKLLSDYESSEVEQERLLFAHPVIVQSIDKKDLEIEMKFKAPPSPGSYKIRVDIKSQEFLGCDFTKDIIVNVVDEASVKKEVDTFEDHDDDDVHDGGTRGGDETDSDEEDGDAILVNSPSKGGSKGAGELRQRKNAGR